MPVTISKNLIKKLPPTEQPGFEAFLREKAGGFCVLCGEAMNEAADVLVADHDVPEVEGGKTERSNFNLVHRSCNATKRNSPSVDVRPLLKLQAFLRKQGPLVKYGEVLAHFQIAPKQTELQLDAGRASFKFADGSTAIVDVMSEKNRKRSYDFAYVEVPREALFNDADCQPRNLKIQQISAIYTDLQRNPLHEAPGCRVSKIGQGKLVQLLMFDGQHKTVASWMLGRERITVKVYFDLPAADSIVLVNSIQAKIKKLPLSPFELAAKMADEWANKLSEYETAVGSEEASEAGFIAWLPPAERARAKQAFHSALVQDMIDDPGLQFRNYVSSDAARKSKPAITEKVFKNKVLEELLHMAPIAEKGEEGTRLRAREHAHVVRVLNALVQSAFQFEGPEPPPNHDTRVKRMGYQASLSYVSRLMRQVFGHEMHTAAPNEFMKSEPSDEQWARIEEAVRRIAAHPVWTADLSSSKKLKAVDDALLKNQSIEKAFESVRLDAAYAAKAREWKPADHED